MRIGFFVAEFSPQIRSGLGTYAVNICRALKQQGHEISVFTMNDGTLKTRETMDGIDVNRPLLVNGSAILPPLLTMNNLLTLSTSSKYFNDVLIFNVLSAAKFVNQLIKKDEKRFELICAHNWQSALAGIMVKRETGLAFVFHLHSIEDIRAPLKTAPMIRHIEETAAKVADRIITVCYPLHDYLIMHGFDARKLRVCWNTVDRDFYDPDKVDPERLTELRARYGIAPAGKLLLLTAASAQIKDVLTALEAFQALRPKHPGAKLVILGRPEFTTQLAQKLTELHIEEQVTLLPELVSADERRAHYAAADVIFSPSLYGPCNMISLEAMAMKKPVIIGAKGICSTCDHIIPVGDDQTGVLADSSDPADLALHLCSLLDHPEQAVKMGRRGRRRMEAYQAWDKIAARTLTIYEEAIEAAGP
jgi:glycogen(starch) synthase